VGREQLRKLDANNGRRNALLAHYRTRLALIRGIQMPFAGRDGVAHLAVAVLGDSYRRDGLRAALSKEGIQSSLHYPPIHLFEHYRGTTGHREGDFPVAEALAARAITLPLYATMTLREVDHVCACVASFLMRAEAADEPNDVRAASGQQHE
jgi:dTDP-4-amino-4,6-dideoxygalactose transaminase